MGRIFTGMISCDLNLKKMQLLIFRNERTKKEKPDPGQIYAYLAYLSLVEV
jgi:hypothetical protein